jgi:hypothetical protein
VWRLDVDADGAFVRLGDVLLDRVQDIEKSDPAGAELD